MIKAEQTVTISCTFKHFKLFCRTKSLSFFAGSQRIETARGKKKSLFILYNQRDATYIMFFIVIKTLHVSGGPSSHHQEPIKLYVQPWLLSCFFLSTAGLDQR